MFRRTQSRRAQFGGRPVFWARMVQSALLCVIAIAMLGAGRSPYERVGHELMCACGCSAVLLDCNHLGCPDRERMENELHAHLAAGESETAVLHWFAAKYGATVLAAPIRGGFDDVAWIVPIAVFLLATVGTFAVVWMWKRRALSLARASAGIAAGGGVGEFPEAGQAAPEEAAMRERIRRETEY